MYKHYTRKVYIKEIQEDVRLMIHTKLFFNIIIMFFLSSNLYGCDYRNYIYTEDSLKRVAEKSLEKKYGEEFIVHRAWNRSQTMFFADCSPKDNPDVIFTADIRKNGDGIISDGYAQGVVAKEVDDVLKDDFKKLFGDCYTRPYISNYYNVPEFIDAKGITIQEYISKVNPDVIGMSYGVYIDASQLSNDAIDRETEYLCNEIPKKIQNRNIPNLSIHIRFVTNELIEQCRTYFSDHVDIDSDLSEELRKHVKISLKYNQYGEIEEIYEGNINRTYGEYRELRNNIDLLIPKEQSGDMSRG